MPSIGLPGSATYAVTLGSIEDMLSVLPDNNANEIAARDVRDVVYTLYQDIVGLSNSFSQFDIKYTNLEPSSAAVGGITQGVAFNNRTIQQMFDDMFYPYVAPTTTFTVSPSVIEYGDSSAQVSLNWGIQAKKNNILTANITRPNNTPTVTSVTTPNANQSASGTLAGGIPTLNTTTQFSFEVNDSSQTITKDASVTWGSRKYYGSIDLYTLTQYDGVILTPILNLTLRPLALNPVYATAIENVLTNTAILSLQNNTLSSGPALAETNIATLNDTFMIFAWPTTAVTINFFVGAGSQLRDTAFTKVRSNWSGMTNSFGYDSTNYDVWISNVAYPSATRIRITTS